MLRCLTHEIPREYDAYLPQFEFALNIRANRTTNHSLFYIVYTKVPNFSVDLQVILSPKSKTINVWATDYAQFHQ